MKSKLSMAVAALIALLQLLVAPAQAAAPSPNASNITIRPFIQQVTLDNNQPTKQVTVSVDNGSGFRQRFHAAAVDFGSLNETGGLTFQGQNVTQLNKFGLAKWLSLDKPDFELDSGQQTTLTATITNDPSLAPGAHYSAIIVSASRPGSLGTQLTITPKVSSLIFATKLGGDVYDEHLESISTDASFWHLPTEVNVRLKSTGNTFITPRGLVWLIQGNNQVYKGVINDQSALVLPGAIRNFNVPLAKIGQLQKGFLFTRYSIRVDYRYDGDPNFAIQSYNYRTINYATLLILAVLVILAAAAVSYKRKVSQTLSRKHR